MIDIYALLQQAASLGLGAFLAVSMLLWKRVDDASHKADMKQLADDHRITIKQLADDHRVTLKQLADDQRVALKEVTDAYRALADKAVVAIQEINKTMSSISESSRIGQRLEAIEDALNVPKVRK